MKYNLRKKGLVLGIIALFVGVAIAPGITATVNLTDAASTRVSENKDLNNDPLEITVEIGNSEHKVMLTQDQVKELENIIDLTKKRLDAAETKKETSRIFNETVVSLYELGVLPKGISIEEMQRLVNGMEQNPKILKKLEGRYSRNQGNLDDNENFLCLIAGKTDETLFIRAGFFLLLRLFSPFFDWLYKKNLQLCDLFLLIIAYIGVFCLIFPNIHPLSIGHTICLGNWYPSKPPDHVPASGWIHTIGLNGIKSWNGSFFGKLPEITGDEGIFGFTGIKIRYLTLLGFPPFYMGTALCIKIEEV